MEHLKNSTQQIESYRRILLSLYPEVKQITENIPTYNPEYPFIADIPAQIIAHLCKNDTQKITQAIQGYIHFCDTFKQKQIEFVRNKVYAYQDFAQVNAEVYQNKAYMTQIYYPALLFSYLFSSNYFEILRIFLQIFIPLTQQKQGKTCEIGIGHGLLSSLLLKNNPHLQGIGIDISPVAREVTDQVSQFLGLSPIPVRIEDATQAISQKENAVMICAEVLEHLPNPEKLLQSIYAALDEGGLLFLTASINMESVDHLYLFQSDEEVVSMVEGTGFKVLERRVAFLTAQNYRNDERLQQRLMKRRNPCTSVLILSK
ncbi:MAG: class I SAM-dependent methyltransferase [Bacteroidia bacterium]|nr:class I SAM-dependent methyltransferase [Bacteroidia bacterium]MDW8347595.1 class I SAM-dependent methyltransferase [Bacteroidia bacterium]